MKEKEEQSGNDYIGSLCFQNKGGGETFKKDPKLNQFMYRKRNTNNPHVLLLVGRVVCINFLKRQRSYTSNAPIRALLL